MAKQKERGSPKLARLELKVAKSTLNLKIQNKPVHVKDSLFILIRGGLSLPTFSSYA